MTQDGRQPGFIGLLISNAKRALITYCKEKVQTGYTKVDSMSAVNLFLAKRK